MRYIIQPGIQIGRPESTNINVLTPEQVNDYRKEGFKCRERIYQLTSGHIRYEVICVEIWQKGDKEHSLIIPSFLIPHRIFPAYVYAYAINQYGSNPQMSQRKVAEETRKKYNLKTFAHTTVGRAMKALTEALRETAAIDSETTKAARITEQNEINAGIIHTERFRTVQDTKPQREIVNSVFTGGLKDYIRQGFKEASDNISIYWYTHFYRLLM